MSSATQQINQVENKTYDISQTKLWLRAAGRAIGVALITFPLFLAIVAPFGCLASRAGTRLGITFGISGGIPVLIGLLILRPWKLALETKERKKCEWAAFTEKFRNSDSSFKNVLPNQLKIDDWSDCIKSKFTKELALGLKLRYGLNRYTFNNMQLLASLSQVDAERGFVLQLDSGINLKLNSNIVNSLILKNSNLLKEVNQSYANLILKLFDFKGGKKVTMEALKFALLIERDNLYFEFKSKSEKKFIKENLGDKRDAKYVCALKKRVLEQTRIF